VTEGARWFWRDVVTETGNGLALLALVVGVTAGGVLLDRPAPFIAFVAIGVAALILGEGAYREWRAGVREAAAARSRASAYEGDTELQRGTADLIRAGEELRRRWQGTSRWSVNHGLGRDLIDWAADVAQFYEGSFAYDLTAEFRAELGELEVVDGCVTGLVATAFLDRGLDALRAIQARLRGSDEV
jgi:hypothetical protein